MRAAERSQKQAAFLMRAAERSQKQAAFCVRAAERSQDEQSNIVQLHYTPNKGKCQGKTQPILFTTATRARPLF